MQTVNVKVPMTEEDFAYVVTEARRRGVSFTTALHQIIATERYLHDHHSGGRPVVVHPYDGAAHGDRILWR